MISKVLLHFFPKIYNLLVDFACGESFALLLKNFFYIHLQSFSFHTPFISFLAIFHECDIIIVFAIINHFFARIYYFMLYFAYDESTSPQETSCIFSKLFLLLPPLFTFCYHP